MKNEVVTKDSVRCLLKSVTDMRNIIDEEISSLPFYKFSRKKFLKELRKQLNTEKNVYMGLYGTCQIMSVDSESGK